MSTQRRRYQTDRWCLDIMDKPWFIDLLTYLLVGAWMAWTFGTIQQQGAGPWLLLSAVIVLVVGLLLIYNQRVAYFRLGDTLVLGTREAVEGEEETAPEQTSER